MSIYPEIPQLLINKNFDIQTPAIIYDVEAIKYVVKKIKDNISKIPNTHICFSVKANRNISLLKTLVELGIGADVASIAELDVAKSAGFQHIYATSPSFSSNEIEVLYKNGIIPDFSTVSQLKEALKNGSVENKIGLRVKFKLDLLDSELETTFGEQSRFGIDVFSSDIKMLLKKYGLKVKQIHVHLGEIRNSNIMSQVALGMEKMVEMFPEVEVLNFGGGLTYLYSDENEVTKTWDILEGVIKRINKLLNRQVKVIIEPGMLLMAMCGYLVSTVLTSDVEGNHRIVTLDSSAWNLMYWTPPILVYTYTNNLIKDMHKICGSTCYEKDIFIQSNYNERLDIGDRVLLAPAGAYVTSMARNMHGFPLPDEWILNNNRLYRVGGREVGVN
ncbi:hypothetical protein PDJ95_09500 [Bacillus cereus]|jgi:diaminopimelate decarboxylase|uniref:diaminopimelate decarboxylase family protein n=1 Tax=Bacillus cereus group TaxID=86661 RepID=UPI000414F9E3|nr:MULTISPECIES: hypothetical protein [Bacillus cereus group]MCA1001302.1 hypothetical protein [Bacillus thuringiensis]MDA1771621.1 hypothetical protein [Bacillus cereus]MDA2337529.1 hypothetical protein [Bacillus cereus]MDA2346870.1 hypothetical protein [Bacillus cereus]MDA2351950.1 hypothetical protein [Bacillus cereus]